MRKFGFSSCLPPAALVGGAEDMGQNSKLNHPLKMSTKTKDRGSGWKGKLILHPNYPQSGSEQALP